MSEDFFEEHDRNVKKRTRIILVCILAVLVIAGGVYAWYWYNGADISDYGDAEILITGLPGGDFTITPYGLLELDCTSVSANGGTRKSSGVNGTGPELETFLAQYGKTTSDFKKIRFICKDDYITVLKNDYLTDDYQIVMAVTQIGKALPSKLQPLRIIIPEGESAKWAYGIMEIDFIE